MEEVRRKRGRPAKDGSRRNQVKTVMNDEELFRLRKISKKSGLSQMNIMRIGAAMFIGELERLYPDVVIDSDFDDFGEFESNFDGGFDEGFDGSFDGSFDEGKDDI